MTANWSPVDIEIVDAVSDQGAIDPVPQIEATDVQMSEAVAMNHPVQKEKNGVLIVSGVVVKSAAVSETAAVDATANEKANDQDASLGIRVIVADVSAAPETMDEHQHRGAMSGEAVAEAMQMMDARGDGTLRIRVKDMET